MTDPQVQEWPATEPGPLRRSEVSACIGAGDAAWARAAHEVLRWGVKTGSGFAVDDAQAVTPGTRRTITARIAGVTIREPVEVLIVVEADDRVGFSYRTLPGHPVDGEEAFIVHRAADDVILTVRSLTRAAPQQPWRLLFPVLLLAQRVARRRYLRALR